MEEFQKKIEEDDVFLKQIQFYISMKRKQGDIIPGFVKIHISKSLEESSFT